MSASLPCDLQPHLLIAHDFGLNGVVLLGGFDRGLVLLDERRELVDQPIDHRQKLLAGGRLDFGGCHALAKLFQIRQRPLGIFLGLLLGRLFFVQNLADQLLPQQFLLRIDLLQRRWLFSAGDRLRHCCVARRNVSLSLSCCRVSGSSWS